MKFRPLHHCSSAIAEWIGNIEDTRSQVDAKFVSRLQSDEFVLVDGKYVRQGAASPPSSTRADPAISFTTPEEGSERTQPLFQTA